MAAGRWNPTIEKGATWRRTIRVQEDDGVTPVDLSGWSARMQLRPSIVSSIVLVELATAPGSGITIDGPAGEVVLELTAEQTAALDGRRANYDLELTAPDGTQTDRLLQGVANLVPEVTR